MKENRSEIKDFIKQAFDHVVVSISGGKDSSVLMQYALDNFPLEKLIFVHATIDIDWDETKQVVIDQCIHFGVADKLHFVQAIDKTGKLIGFVDILERKKISKGESVEQMFPSMDCRWCTSSLKTGPINKLVRTLKGNIVVLIGERAEESDQRALLEAIRFSETLSVNGRTVHHLSPILPCSEREVWSVIKENKIPVHPCYSLGVSRASCAVCIFSSNKEIAVAGNHAPHIVARLVKAERKLSTSYRYKAPTKKYPDGQRESLEMILKLEGAWDKVAELVG
jgi:3'-phosphoadenosine 5'-phosphosulfate sulfotransferase (PAPS reductase)/FAD synthetase